MPGNYEHWEFLFNVPKPHRLDLDYAFLSAYAGYLVEKPEVSWEEWWEWRAMCRRALERRTSRFLESTLHEDDVKVFKRIQEKHVYIPYSSNYELGATGLYNLVYSPVVEPYDKWERLTALIDSRQDQMEEGEYDKLIALLRLHGTEITNCQCVMQRIDLLGNPAAKNFIEFRELFKEIVALPQGSGHAFHKNFLKVKIECGLKAGFLTIPERYNLLSHLNGFPGSELVGHMSLH